MSLIHLIELILVVVILIAVGVPLFGKTPSRKLFSTPDEKVEEYKHLQVRKEEVLLSIKELEFDFKTDKLSETDYRETKKKLESEAMAILQRMDELESQTKTRKKPLKKVDAA